MSAIVFAGPTIGPAAVREVLDARCLPPAGQGDVHRAVALYRPRTIGIVDGYFQHVPSVWHKEILWALGEGVHVFGSASIGALRAAELDSYGMRGIGLIFEAYRRGVLEPSGEPFEDDDEVAVIHGPAELGYLALSEAMVNIRCTLARAETEGIVGRSTARALVATAKGLFYQDRTYDRVLEIAAGRSIAASELAAFRRWLPAGRIDQKRADAEAMLLAMRELLAADSEPMRVTFRFEPTTMWERAVAAGAGGMEPESEEGGDSEDLIDEVRLQGAGAFRELRRAALARFLGLAETRRSGIKVTHDEVRRELKDFRREAGLARRTDVEGWLADNDVDARGLERLIEDEAGLVVLERQLGPALGPHLLDQLRLRNDYVRIATRARAKRQATAGEPPVDERRRLGLLAWYFEGRRQEPVPEDVTAYARSLGFADAGRFLRALQREYAFVAEAESDPVAARGDAVG